MAQIYNDKERYSIANEIWQQLGAQRFSLVTGCNPITYGEKDGKVYLLMSVGKNCHAINRFEVAYNEGVDLYEVRFMRSRRGQMHIVANYTEVYADMMRTLFEQETGMVTTLPRIAS